MKAFALEELGTAGSVMDVPVPEPSDGEVRVRVVAAGLNPFDAFVIQGAMKDQMEHRFPLVPGTDASGTVDAIGPGVDGVAIGDEVFGSVGKRYLGGGSLAEFTTMATGTIGHKPPALDHPAAAAVPVAAGTALTMIEAAPVSDGDVVVVIGATGGVGSYYLQLAARRGARVIAICSAGNAGYARSLGATDVVDHAAGDVVEAVRTMAPELDVVADLHRGDTATRLAELVRAGGHVVSAVGGADADALRAREVTGTNVTGRVATEPLETLAGMLERGELINPEIRSYPLQQATEAFEQVGSGHTRGKVVVVP
jgi:NADPH2:quinone reductase